MRNNANLILIDKVCRAYENTQNEDTGFAAEVLRVIRAIATNGQVTLIAGGMTADLLKTAFPRDKLLWSIVSVEDDSVPASARPG